MRLLDMMEVLGDRLGILQAEEARAATPAGKIQTRKITLVELTMEIRSEEVQALAELPAELSIEFDRVFESAGLTTPPNGWNIEKLKKLLRSDEFNGLERVEIQKKLQGIFSNEKVSVEDLVKEAIARDRALDAFESFVKKKMDSRLAVRERNVAEIETRIQELQKEAARERELARSDNAKWKEWHSKKRSYEQELAWVASHLVDHQVVTIDPDSD